MPQFDSTYLCDPSTVAAYDDAGTLQVVIETPKGSRNKYAYDHERHVLVLKKVLPAGMVFPYDFGFVPSTLADDGDPIDVLLLMDEPAFPGCVLDARLIGVIEGEDELEDGKKRRNDRLLAVAAVSKDFDGITHVDQLAPSLRRHMEEFFEAYPRLLSGKTYKVIACKGPEEATRLVDEAARNAQR